jgi:hypothetical protein
LNKFKSLAAVAVLFSAVGFSSAANADLLPIPPITSPDICSTLHSLVPAGTPADQIEAGEILKALGLLPADTTVGQISACYN